MKIFNMGGQELFYVFLIMFIFLGPTRMKNTAKNVARLIRKIVHSETWKQMLSLYSEVKEIPKEIVKEAELEDIAKETKKSLIEINKDLQEKIDQASIEIDKNIKDQNKS